MNFQNPFIVERADPYVLKGSDGWYYFTASYPMKREDDPEGYDRVILRRSRTLAGLACAEEITIWRATEKTSTHRFIWAPELYFIGGKWYVFYAGSSSAESYWHIDCHVLQCLGNDPYTDEWVEKGLFGRLPEDGFSFSGFSLDMTYFEAKGRSYVIWAQQSPVYKISTLYLGEVNPAEPWKLITMPMKLTEPEYAWEKVRFPVNEGPAVLKKNGKVYVAFSASGTGPEYCMGLLEAEETADLLQAESWKKYDMPLLSSENLTDEFGPGHNSFTTDEEGNDVCVYHARSRECFEKRCGYAANDPLFDPCRHARIRRIVWETGNLPFCVENDQSK